MTSVDYVSHNPRYLFICIQGGFGSQFKRGVSTISVHFAWGCCVLKSYGGLILVNLSSLVSC